MNAYLSSLPALNAVDRKNAGQMDLLRGVPIDQPPGSTQKDDEKGLKVLHDPNFGSGLGRTLELTDEMKRKHEIESSSSISPS